MRAVTPNLDGIEFHVAPYRAKYPNYGEPGKGVHTICPGFLVAIPVNEIGTG